MLTHSTKPEMYPEYVIVSWDSLILLLDAEKIEWKVQLDAEKNLNVYAKYKLQEKTASHDTQICDSWKQFVSTDRLFSHSVFRCKFSDLSPKAIVFSHHFPQSLVLSLLCLNSHLLRTLSELFFGETIGDTADLQTIIYHFSRFWVCCMLSKRISSFS